MVREGLTDEGTSEGVRYADKQRGENKGKDLKLGVPGVSEEQQGDWCGWNRVRTMQGGDV